MSTFFDRELHCPRCGTALRAMIADGLHITRVPAVRQRLLEGTLHQVGCSGCGVVVEVTTDLLYTDFARHHWVEVRPDEEVARWRQHEDETLATYERGILRAAPAMVRALDPRFTVRCVFGYAELRDKVLLWDANLDDSVVECVKLELARERPSLLASGRRLMVTAVDLFSRHLTLESTAPGTGDDVVLTVDLDLDPVEQAHAERSRYEAELPELFGRGFVSVTRLFVTSS